MPGGEKVNSLVPVISSHRLTLYIQQEVKNEPTGQLPQQFGRQAI